MSKESGKVGKPNTKSERTKGFEGIQGNRPGRRVGEKNGSKRLTGEHHGNEGYKSDSVQETGSKSEIVANSVREMPQKGERKDGSR